MAVAGDFNTISLKNLNPAGDGRTPYERLKAPTSGLRGPKGTCGDASRERSAVRGGFPVAEATILATTSLMLHGMAGFQSIHQSFNQSI